AMTTVRPSVCHAAGASLLLLVAASGDEPTAPEMVRQEVEDPSTPAFSALLTCRVDVAAGSMRCDPAAGLPGSSGGPQMNLIVGSQHRFVRLANDPPVVEDGVWSANVTVQNLTLQPVGTLDGEDADLLGVRGFFVDEPSHGVGVLNHDGTDTFLGGTPAEYDGYSGSDLGAGGILSQGEVSRARQWQFRLNGATEFRFSVLVSTEVPDPGAFGVHLTRV